MQVLYQLSYGPMCAGSEPAVRPVGWREHSLHRSRPRSGDGHTWRHTATRRPCTLTCSAGSTIGA